MFPRLFPAAFLLLAATGAHAATTVSYTTIADTQAIVTGIRSDSTTTDSVVITSNYTTGGVQYAGLYEGSLSATTTAPSSSWNKLLPATINAQAVSGATFYGPNTSLFNPSIGAGNVIAVGSYKIVGSGADHGLLYQGPIVGGGTWTNIDATPLLHLGENLLNTIAHSNMGDLVVGNYDTDLATGKAFILNRSTNHWTNLNPGNTVSVTAYGIWQNGGSSSTNYTICGGQGHTTGVLDQSYLVDYDSSTGAFSNYTVFNYNNVPGTAELSHFDGITATSTGYTLTGFVTEGMTVRGFYASISRNANGSFATPAWVEVFFPGQAVTTGNTIVENKVLGIFVGGGGAQSYIATVTQYGIAITASKSGTKATFKITNTGNTSAGYRIGARTKATSGQSGPAPGKPRYSVSYTLDGADKSGAIAGDGAVITLDPAQTAKVVEKVKAKATLNSQRTIHTTLEATAKASSSTTDSAKVQLILKAQ